MGDATKPVPTLLEATIAVVGVAIHSKKMVLAVRVSMCLVDYVYT